LNGFSNGEYQSPQRSQPASSNPSAKTAKMSPVVRTIVSPNTPMIRDLEPARERAFIPAQSLA